MGNISVLALDPKTRDLCFDADGNMLKLWDSEAIAQNIRNNLLTWKGEFPLNTAHGTDWPRVVGRSLSEGVDEADDVLRSSIFQEPYVREITELTPQLEGRALGAVFTGVLYDGSTVRLEVDADG